MNETPDMLIRHIMMNSIGDAVVALKGFPDLDTKEKLNTYIAYVYFQLTAGFVLENLGPEVLDEFIDEVRLRQGTAPQTLPN